MKQTSLEQSIKLAVENGWKPFQKEEESGLVPSLTWARIAESLWQNTVLDVDFWQALGRGLGWGECNCPITKLPIGSHEIGCKRKDWRYHHHRLIDWIDDGKSVEEFFEDIISNK